MANITAPNNNYLPAGTRPRSDLAHLHLSREAIDQLNKAFESISGEDKALKNYPKKIDNQKTEYCKKMITYYATDFESDLFKQRILAVVSVIISAIVISLITYGLVTWCKSLFTRDPGEAPNVGEPIGFALTTAAGITASGGLIAWSIDEIRKCFQKNETEKHQNYLIRSGEVSDWIIQNNIYLLSKRRGEFLNVIDYFTRQQGPALNRNDRERYGDLIEMTREIHRRLNQLDPEIRDRRPEGDCPEALDAPRPSKDLPFHYDFPGQ